MRRIIAKPLGQLLIENKLITQENLDRALAIQKESGGLLGQILVSSGFTTEEAIARMLTVQYGFPYLSMDGFQLDPQISGLISESIARQYGLIAVDKVGSFLTVVMSNPLNQQAVEEVERATGLKVQACISTTSDISAAIGRAY